MLALIAGLVGLASTLGVLAWARGEIAKARAGEHEALTVADVQTDNADQLRDKLDRCLADYQFLHRRHEETVVDVDKLRVELKKHETAGQRLGRLGRL